MASKHVQPGFFDLEERYARLSRAGDPLEALNKAVDWELFRKPLRKALKKAGRSDGKKGGRPPFDPVLMFKACPRESGDAGSASAVWSFRR